MIKQIFLKISLFFLLNVYFLETSVYAQNVKEIDSLKIVLHNSNSDSLKISLLEKLIIFYRKENPKTHKKYIKQGLEISDKLSLKQKKAIFQRELGIYYKNISKIDSSLYQYKVAESIFYELNDKSNYYATKISVANIEKRLGNYEKSAELLIDAIEFYESINKQKNALIGKVNLAALYGTMNELDKAISTYEETLKSIFATDNIKKVSYINLTGLCIKNKEIDKAEKYAKEAETILTTEKSKKSLANLYVNLGALYEEKNQLEKSLNYFQKALSIFEKINDKEGVLKSKNNIGNINSKLNKKTEAEIILLKTNQELEASKNIYSLANNYQMLSKMYYKSKEFDKAYYYADKWQNLKDSIFKLEKYNAISELETKYEVNKKILEAENANKKREIAELESSTNKKYLYGTVIIAILILITSILYFFNYKNKKNAEIIQQKFEQTKSKLELEKQFHNSELKALKAQMNPHFMFNAMNSIQNLVLKNNKEGAYTYLTKFANLIRKNLEMSEKSFTYLEDELQQIETYLELEKLRFKSDFTYFISQNIDNKDEIKIPPMLIQPFVENAIKHGLLHKNNTQELKINFELSDNLICTVEDNGIGRKASEKINQSKSSYHESFATEAISKRFNLLKEYYNFDLGFTYIDLQDNNGNPLGTKVIIKIPYIFDDE